MTHSRCTWTMDVALESPSTTNSPSWLPCCSAALSEVPPSRCFSSESPSGSFKSTPIKPFFSVPPPPSLQVPQQPEAFVSSYARVTGQGPDFPGPVGAPLGGPGPAHRHHPAGHPGLSEEEQGRGRHHVQRIVAQLIYHSDRGGTGDESLGLFFPGSFHISLTNYQKQR